jgi:hypothetical protein
MKRMGLIFADVVIQKTPLRPIISSARSATRILESVREMPVFSGHFGVPWGDGAPKGMAGWGGNLRMAETRQNINKIKAYSEF